MVFSKYCFQPPKENQYLQHRIKLFKSGFFQWNSTFLCNNNIGLLEAAPERSSEIFIVIKIKSTVTIFLCKSLSNVRDNNYTIK